MAAKMSAPKSPAQKMGWKPGMTARLAGSAAELSALLPEVVCGAGARFLVGYCRDPQEVDQCLADLVPHYPAGGYLWFIYPKKSGRVVATISRDVGWQGLVDLGFLPVSLVSVDADHSALRFRRRSEIARLTRKT
jgi:hypothetical protein